MLFDFGIVCSSLYLISVQIPKQNQSFLQLYLAKILDIIYFASETYLHYKGKSDDTRKSYIEKTIIYINHILGK